MPASRATPVDAYFICATPRTGSSLLAGLLEATGVAGRPQAYFRPADEPAWVQHVHVSAGAGAAVGEAAFLEAVRRVGTSANGVFGAKLMWDGRQSLLGRLRRLRPELAGDDRTLLNAVFGRIGYVSLFRQDMIAQAVSWLRAEQTGVWFVGGRGELAAATPSGRPPAYDAAAITRLRQVIAQENAAWRHWFTALGLEPLRLSYEELQADYDAAVRSVIEALGVEVPEDHAAEAFHVRQFDALNAAWIDRYRRQVLD